MSTNKEGRTHSAVEPLVRPKSVAIIGMSSKPGSPSRTVLENLRANGFDGDIHFVGKSGGEIEGRRCLTEIADLPRGVDLAILVVAAAAVKETIEACVAAGVRSAVCFASGFAEMGDEGRRAQEEIGRIARDGNLALIGPNCVGYFNYVDRFAVMLVEIGRITQLSPESGAGVAIVAQSGGIGAHFAASLTARGVPVSYMMTTGNEASLGLTELIEFYVGDTRTSVILVYAEQIRKPAELLRVVKIASEAGKPVVLLHPGKSARAQAAAASHTGALAGDYAAMRVALEAGGVLVADSLEEAVDLSELVLRCPWPQADGLGMITASGALCAIAQDYCEPLGLSMPPMSQLQVAALAPHLPEFTPPRNPLDLGTLVAWQPDLLRLGVRAMFEDPGIGAVLVSFPYGEPSLSVPWIKAIASAGESDAKPLIYAVHDEGVALPSEVEEIARRHRIIISRSPERALRTLARLVEFARNRRAEQDAAPLKYAALPIPPLGAGAQAEWRGKEILRAVGVPVPAGRLAASVQEALAIAAEIGFPVVIKAQTAQLSHKSDVGGVILNIKDDDALKSAWAMLHENIERAEPGLCLDGVLVEKMAPKGLELVIGAKRDRDWGPMLLVGLGGVWIEALGDVQLLPADAGEAQIIDGLKRLRGAKLLQGFRGAPPVDLAAVATAAVRLGQLMIAHPEILEIDVNPFIAFAQGEGGVAVDALVVTA